MEPVKTEDLVAKVRKIAAAHPDVVYPVGEDGVCLYNYPPCGPGSGCLIGQALGALSPGVLSEVTVMLATVTISGIIRDPFMRPHFSVGDERHVSWLRAVQARQDMKEPWGEAVRLADRNDPLE